MQNVISSFLVLVTVTGCAHTSFRPQAREAGKVVFYCPAKGSSVFLIGDFNQWESKQPMTESTKGAAQSVVPLKPGFYAYSCLYQDGHSAPPPDAPAYLDDGFGGSNAWIEVKP